MLELDVLSCTVPTVNICSIPSNTAPLTFFLFIITVFDVVLVEPVLDTLYPASSNSSTAFCRLLLVPLPFITSNFISDFVFVETELEADVEFVMFPVVFPSVTSSGLSLS